MSILRLVIVLAIVLAVGYVLLSRFATGGEAMTPDRFVEAYEPGDVIIDARTPREYAGSHLAGAVNLDVMGSDFRERAESLPRGRRVFIYCASGHRSGRAAGILEGMGFPAVYNVGGMDALASAGAEVEVPGR